MLELRRFVYMLRLLSRSTISNTKLLGCKCNCNCKLQFSAIIAHRKKQDIGDGFHTIPAGISSPTGYLASHDAAKLDSELMSTTGFSREQLMEMTGSAVAEAVYTILDVSSPIIIGRKKILLVAGPGNNGGDGLVAARHLALIGFDVSVVYPTPGEKAHSAKLAQQAGDVGVKFLDEFPSQSAMDGDYSVIVDAMFGFSFSSERGMSSPYDAILSDLISTQNGDQGTKIVSVDVPSSWDVDGGDILGTGFVPDALVSLTAPKLCAEDFSGRHFVGGRFLSPTLSKKYGVRMPPYQGVSQVMEVSETASANGPAGGAAADSLEMDYARRLAAKNVEVEHGRGQWEYYGDLETFTVSFTRTDTGSCCSFFSLFHLSLICIFFCSIRLGFVLQPGKYQVKCFNKISLKGLEGLTGDEKYDVRPDGIEGANAHAILLRSHKLKEEDVPKTCRAIARCGSGVNNIPVARMTELGIPVFNTPGANANAVKELLFCGMLMGSRRIIDGVNHMKELARQGIAKERVEKDKAMFGGRELKGKTLAVIGLGNIGAQTSRDASLALGMKTVGYDPYLSVENAMTLPNDIFLADSIKEAVATADYISLNIPYITGEGGTHGVINKEITDAMKDDAVLLNFARGELVDSEAMKEFLDRGNGRYISDFPDDLLWDHDNMIILPHLGASTEEAEDCAASMAAEQVRDFLETGAVRNSVNFPAIDLPDRAQHTVRFTVVSHDAPGILGHINEVFGEAGLNIVQEIAKTRGPISYTVLDVDTTECGDCESDTVCFNDVQEKITMLDGVCSSRIIYGKPGSGYAKNLEGDYFV